MCFSQRHLKRLLAFSTISHVGMFLCGIGLLSAQGLAGVATYVIGHGLTKAALFMLVGVLLHRFGTVDEFDLHGRGRALPTVGALFGLAGLLLAAVPITTEFFGKSLLDGAALDGGYGWLPAVFVISSVFTGGAVLRVGARVFLGWGPASRSDEDGSSAPRGTGRGARNRGPHAAADGVRARGVLWRDRLRPDPGVVPGIERAAAHFGDHRRLHRMGAVRGGPASLALRSDGPHRDV